MKTREEIFNEVLELYREGKIYIIVDITEEVIISVSMSTFDAIIEGSVWKWKTNEEAKKRKVAKTGEFEDDLYYLIDLLIEDAKVAQML